MKGTRRDATINFFVASKKFILKVSANLMIETTSI